MTEPWLGEHPSDLAVPIDPGWAIMELANAVHRLAAAMRAVAHGDVSGPGGLEALAMGLVGGDPTKMGLGPIIADAIGEVAEAIRERA